MKALVSIIIPVYNAEPFLAQTIQSAIRQSWPDKELIIVDDGSTDGSLLIAQGFEGPGIKILKQDNKGASAARNYGISVAQGDFIQFLDADDLISPDKIERQLALIAAENNCISFCEQLNFGSDKGFEPVKLNVKHISNPFSLLLALYGGNGDPGMIAVHAWLCPAAVIRRAGPWNEALSMDDDGEFFCRVVLASEKVIFCADVYCYYRKYNSKSLSMQKSLKHLRSELLSTQLKTALMLKVADNEQVKKAMAFWFFRIAILAYPKYRSVSKLARLQIRALGVRPGLPVMGGTITEGLKKIMGWKFVRLVQFLKS